MLNVLFYPKTYILKHLISKMDFTATKYSGQGRLTVNKETIDKLLFLLKTIGIYPSNCQWSFEIRAVIK